MTESLEELQEKVALSCRILGKLGLVKGELGHVSARVPGAEGEMLMSCRGPGAEFGVRFLEPRAVKRVDFDGRGADLGADHYVPAELPVHGEIYKVRPDVGCVIHAHPPGVLLCGLANVDFYPITDSYDPQVKRVSVEGVPIYPFAKSVTTLEEAAAMIKAMGGRDTCLMRGHGVTVTGQTVEEATNRAVALESLARIFWQLRLAGAKPEPLKGLDAVRHVVDSGTLWRYYVRLLDEPGTAPEMPFGIEDVEI